MNLAEGAPPIVNSFLDLEKISTSSVKKPSSWRIQMMQPNPNKSCQHRTRRCVSKRGDVWTLNTLWLKWSQTQTFWWEKRKMRRCNSDTQNIRTDCAKIKTFIIKSNERASESRFLMDQWASLVQRVLIWRRYLNREIARNRVFEMISWDLWSLYFSCRILRALKHHQGVKGANIYLSY